MNFTQKKTILSQSKILNMEEIKLDKRLYQKPVIKIFNMDIENLMNLIGNGGTITPGASGGDAKKNFFGDEDFSYENDFNSVKGD